MKSNPQAEVVRRLHCAAGHLKTVIEMTNAGQPCEQVLHQLNAVEAALRAAGIKLILCQTQASQAIILDSPFPKQRIAELKRLQFLYTIFLQYPKYHSEVSHE